MIRTVALASGSNGNSIHVETPDARLLFDAGLSGVRLAERARMRDVDLDRLDGLLLSHNHGDHVGGAGVIHRRHKAKLFATRGTWQATRGRVGRVEAPGLFRAGETLTFGHTLVHTIPTPHDGVEGVAFVVESEGHRLGILTDLGHRFAELEDTVGTLDAAYIEANYDPEMLLTGPYPFHLRERISGPGGHLSNEECVDMARSAASGRLKLLVLSHLSGENNSPESARAAAESLETVGVEVRLAGRSGPSRSFTLG